MSDQAIDIVGVGALNYDYIVRWSDIPGGRRPRVRSAVSDTERITADENAFLDALDTAIIEADSVTTAHGGSAFNTIRALAHLQVGLRLGYVGVLGTAPRLADRFNFRGEAANLSITHQWWRSPRRGKTATVSFVSPDGERDLHTLYSDDVARTLCRAAQSRVVIDYLSRARHIHVTSVFGDGGSQAVLDLLERARSRARNEIAISVDPGLTWARASRVDPAVARILELADIVFVNESELTELGVPASNLAAAGRIVFGKNRSLKQLIFLKEIHQARILEQHELDGRQVEQLVLPAARIADSTGAGDVFAAGVLAGRLSEAGRSVGGALLGLASARHKLQFAGDEGYKSLSTLFTTGARPVPRTVFVSHASRDEPLATAFVTLLEGMGADEGVFCTSVLDKGLPAGAEFIPEIHQQLSAAVLVIFLVTPAFLRSRFCRYEVGAAWALGKEQIALHHNVRPERLDLMLAGRQMAELMSADGIGLVVTRLRQLRVLPAMGSQQRERRHVNTFLAGLKTSLRRRAKENAC